MTRVLKQWTALFVALALAIGCALAFALPQKAQADSLKLGTSVGAKAEVATNLPLVGKSLSSTAYATFNTTNDNQWYKFTTSNRNSQYRITLQADSADGTVFYTVCDSSMHIFFVSQLTTTNQSTIQLQKLKRGQVYYIKVWRYAVDSPLYNSQVPYADYRLTVKEIVTPPNAVRNLKGKSPSKRKLKVTWQDSRYADGYQLLVKNPRQKKNYYFISKKASWSLKTKYSGKYKVWVRPYRDVNGKRYYGNWNPGTTNSKGKVVRTKNGLRVTVK